MIPMILSENDSVSLCSTGLMRFESWTGTPRALRTSNVERRTSNMEHGTWNEEEEPAASEGLKVVEKSISKTCPAVMSKSFYNDSAVNDSVLIL
jgi:hypothetical protein